MEREAKKPLTASEKEILKKLRRIYSWSPFLAVFQMSQDKKWGRYINMNLDELEWRHIDEEIFKSWRLKRVGKDFYFVYYH